MYITIETEWHPLCCCHDNTLGSNLPVKNKYGIAICNLSKWDRGSYLEHTWFPYCFNSPLEIVGSGWSLLKIKCGNFSLNKNRTSGITYTVVVAMAQQVSFCFFCDIHFWYKFKVRWIHISSGILDWAFYCFLGTTQLWCHHFPHLHNTNMWIYSLKWKKMFQTVIAILLCFEKPFK